MKKELLASVLTFTAGMAATVSFPQASLARAASIEREFAKNFVLKLDAPVRYTKDGKEILGHIYLSLEQSPLNPRYNNQLHGEMSGTLYFESDDLTEEYNGRKYKTYVPLTGDDGEVLLDMTHKSKDGNRYQVYGCNSTQTQCTADSFEVEFGPNKKVSMTLRLAAELKMEIHHVYSNGNSEWLPVGYGVAMVESSQPQQ